MSTLESPDPRESEVLWPARERLTDTDWGAFKMTMWLAGAVAKTGSTFAALYIAKPAHPSYDEGDFILIVVPNWEGSPTWN
jgi:hypothetical protein